MPDLCFILKELFFIHFLKSGLLRCNSPTVQFPIFKCTSLKFGKFTQSCNHCHSQVTEHTHHPAEHFLLLVTANPLSPNPSPSQSLI